MNTAIRGEQTIAFVLYPGLTALDLVGPLQVLTMVERFAAQYRVVVVGERAESTGTDVNLAMIPSHTFAEVPHPDVIVVPGGRAATIRAMSDPAMRDYVQVAAASARIVTSVCTGSLILAASGVLKGRPATTNWFFAGVLESFGVEYRHERWVDDGEVVTSAGVSAGIDMALYLAARLTDEETARRIQLAIDYDPKPPFGPIDWGGVALLPRLMRAGIRVAAPVLTAKPKRLARARRPGMRAAVPHR